MDWKDTFEWLVRAAFPAAEFSYLPPNDEFGIFEWRVRIGVGGHEHSMKLRSTRRREELETDAKELVVCLAEAMVETKYQRTFDASSRTWCCLGKPDGEWCEECRKKNGIFTFWLKEERK